MRRLVEEYAPPEFAQVVTSAAQAQNSGDVEYVYTTAGEVFVAGVILAELVGGCLKPAGMHTATYLAQLANGQYSVQVEPPLLPPCLCTVCSCSGPERHDNARLHVAKVSWGCTFSFNMYDLSYLPQLLAMAHSNHLPAVAQHIQAGRHPQCIQAGSQGLPQLSACFQAIYVRSHVGVGERVVLCNAVEVCNVKSCTLPQICCLADLAN